MIEKLKLVYQNENVFKSTLSTQLYLLAFSDLFHMSILCRWDRHAIVLRTTLHPDKLTFLQHYSREMFVQHTNCHWSMNISSLHFGDNNWSSFYPWKNHKLFMSKKSNTIVPQYRAILCSYLLQIKSSLIFIWLQVVCKKKKKINMEIVEAHLLCR